MAGQLYRALNRSNFLQSIGDLISSIKKAKQQKEESDLIYNRVNQFKTDAQNAVNATMTQDVTRPNPMYAAPLQATGAPSLVQNLGFGKGSPATPSLANMTGVGQPNGMNTLTPENMYKEQVTSPKTYNAQITRPVDLRTRQQNLANQYISLMEDLQKMKYLSPEDKNNALNIAGLVYKTNEPQAPEYFELGQNQTRYVRDPNDIDPSTGLPRVKVVASNIKQEKSRSDKHIGNYEASDGKIHDRWQKADGSIYETIGGSFYKPPREPILDPDRNRKIDSYASVTEGLNKLSEYDTKNLKEYTPDQIASILPKDFMLSKPSESGYIISGKYVPKSSLDALKKSERNKYVKDATAMIEEDSDLSKAANNIQEGLNNGLSTNEALKIYKTVNPHLSKAHEKKLKAYFELMRE